MARAKRTNRAEARRRYRAQLAAESAGELDSPDDDAPLPDRTPDRRPDRTAARPPAASAAPPPQRPGIGTAFRQAFRPANFAEDIAAIPRLIRHRSVWLPALISIGATAVLLVTGGSDVISAIVYQYFIVTPPIGAIFLSGFLAPRASYLTGAFAGLVGAICFAALVAAGMAGTGPFVLPGATPSPSAIASPAPSESAVPSAAPSVAATPAATTAPSAAPSPTPSRALSAEEQQALNQAVAMSFLLSPLTGALFGAAAAWYRRFLNLANPNRGARRPPPNRGKPVRRR